MPVIGAVTCQDITVNHTQKIVNADVIAVMDVTELTGYSEAERHGRGPGEPGAGVVTIVPPADVARRL